MQIILDQINRHSKFIFLIAFCCSYFTEICSQGSPLHHIGKDSGAWCKQQAIVWTSSLTHIHAFVWKRVNYAAMDVIKYTKQTTTAR